MPTTTRRPQRAYFSANNTVFDVPSPIEVIFWEAFHDTSGTPNTAWLVA